MRAIVHYILLVVAITIYGGRVCPLIEALPILHWGLQLAVTYTIVFGIRSILLKTIVLSAPYELQVKRQFMLELSVFIATSLFLAVYNTLVYDFPFVRSGAKVILGCFALGFFATLDLSLQRERLITKEIIAKGQDLLFSKKYFPITAKFVIVACVVIFVIMGVSFLVVAKDLFALTYGAVETSPYGSRWIVFKEFVFVGLVFMLEVGNLIVSYTMNLHLFFKNENSALINVTNGGFDSHVPVATNDEFGVMAKYTNSMIARLKERTEELQLTRDVTIFSLTSLAETRDNETGAHILRTQRYVKVLAEYLKNDPRYRDYLDPETIDLLYKSAPLHDVGKVGIRDSILLKPGKHTDEEFAEMKKHTTYGRDALLKAEQRMGSNSFLRIAREIAYTHHEKWDGTGYPERLQGEGIPVSGRLMAVADVYDALISKRVYKPAFPHEKAKKIIVEGKGKHFDPAMVDAFMAVEEQIKEIADRYGDHREEEATA